MPPKTNNPKSVDEFNDLGLGSKFSSQRQRLLNKNGEFNVEKRGHGFKHNLNFYHEIIRMSWTKFNLLVISYYIITNLIFAFIYVELGKHELTIPEGSPVENFWNAFFFSGQALTTVGFGRISPLGWGASIVASVESLLGLLGFALITGSLYGRFSRATAKIRFSKTAVISPYNDINGFMFRLINQRRNQLINLNIKVMFSQLKEIDGQLVRKYIELPLERQGVNFFPLSWTVVHPIDENSPFYQTSPRELENSDTEILILLEAYDDSFAQSVHTRTSYDYRDMEWGAKFESVFINKPGEVTAIDVNLLDKTIPAKLN